jgi:hypothetical protein
VGHSETGSPGNRIYLAVLRKHSNKILSCKCSSTVWMKNKKDTGLAILHAAVSESLKNVFWLSGLNILLWDNIQRFFSTWECNSLLLVQLQPRVRFFQGLTLYMLFWLHGDVIWGSCFYVCLWYFTLPVTSFPLWY